MSFIGDYEIPYELVLSELDFLGFESPGLFVPHSPYMYDVEQNCSVLSSYTDIPCMYLNPYAAATELNPLTEVNYLEVAQSPYSPVYSSDTVNSTLLSLSPQGAEMNQAQNPYPQTFGSDNIATTPQLPSQMTEMNQADEKIWEYVEEITARNEILRLKDNDQTLKSKIHATNKRRKKFKRRNGRIMKRFTPKRKMCFVCSVCRHFEIDFYSKITERISAIRTRFSNWFGGRCNKDCEKIKN